jgi:hypothetical protein
LTVTTKISGERGMNANATTKQLYKGNKLRTEAGGQVTLYDAATDRITVLQPEKKTYYVTTAKKMSEGMAPFMSMMDISVSGDVKPGGQTKTLLGKPARNYKYTITIKMKAKGGNKDIPNFGAVGMVMQGENWVTTAVSLPNPQAFQKASAAMSGQGMMPGMEKVMEKMTKIPGLPLLTTMQMGMDMSQVKLPKDAKGGKKPQAPPRQTIRQEVVSLSEKPLDDALFAPPKGFRQVPAPTMPDLGAMAGGMQTRPK